MAQDPTVAAEQQFQRLPNDVVPKNYKLAITPDLKAFTFTGKLEIAAEVVRTTQHVVLNCLEIIIIKARVDLGSTSQEANVTYSPTKETATLVFPATLPPGGVVLYLEYTGKLEDNMKGFYRSSYTHPNWPGEERYLGVTQFESTDARRALPCWDEPAIKATFDVTMVVPKHLTALSNMDEVETKEEGEGLKRVTFARTPVMSTYLLAFVVGEFDHVEERDENGLLIRVFTPVGKASKGQFALSVAVKTMPFYSRYFDTPYHLPKLDLIAVPELGFGAMENWGLVTYRERALLIDQNSSTTSKQYVALIVGHELAHQWFGNLVTMEWWTHLWLNEGFASWIEYLCVDFCHPEYEVWTQFITSEYSAMEPDSLASSHPIEVPVCSPAEVEQIFDAISYSKGACVIRMLHGWIGDEAFRKGMKLYLTKFQYKNASTDDLWQALEQSSGKPVASVMNTWTKQMGFPLLTVQEKQDGDNHRVLTVSQQKYCATGSCAGFEQMRWAVPITIATSKKDNALTFVLEKESDTVVLEGVGPEEWILLNPNREGYYRANYPQETFGRLLEALKKGELKERDRIPIVEDTMALARTGVGKNTVDVLKLLQSYTNETSFTVWDSITDTLSFINLLLGSTDFLPAFQSYALTLLGPAMSRLGWTPRDTDSPLDSMLRSMLIQQLGFYGDQSVIAEARRQFDDLINGRSQISPDLKGAVYAVVARHGDEKTCQQLMELHDKAESCEELAKVYRVLGYFQSKEIIARMLDFTFSGKVQPQNTPVVCLSCQKSVENRSLLWDYVKKNWPSLNKAYNTASFVLGKIVGITTSSFATKDKADDIEAFFRENPCPLAETSVKQNCEAIRVNASWLERDRRAVKEWLSGAT
ncbi:hypothetical protein EMCRGX_G018506 [Ephydatia muelleri]